MRVDLFYADLNIAYLQQGQIAIRKYISTDTVENKTTILSGPTLPKNSKLGLNHWVRRYTSLVSDYIITHGKPDIIHAHTYLGGSIASRAKELYNIPFIITEHFTGWMTGDYRPSHYNIAAKAYRQAEVVTTVSNALHDSLHKLFKIESTVLPNFIDFKLFKPAVIENANFNIIGIGDLIPRKQWDLLIRAFTQASNQIPQSSSLTIIGDGPQRKGLQKLIYQLAFNKRIHLVGNLSKIEVANKLSKSELLIHPSKTESFGLTPIEALACGIPVISSSNGGSDEYKDLPGIHLIEEVTVDLLTELIISIYQSRNTITSNKTAIHTACRDRYSVEVIAPKLEALYKKLMMN